MSLNIKNEETHRLARELAAMTGESVTAAVTEAIRERRDRLLEDRTPMADDLLRLGRDVASRLPPSWNAGDPTAELYDDRGLPA